MILFNGQIISSNIDNSENEIIKFEQLKIDLNNFSNTTIKTPKIQETSTIKLINCLDISFFKNIKCNNNFNKEIITNLNRRIFLPFYIPVISLIACMLLIKKKRNIFFSKISIFAYCFLILLFAELIIRYTGVNKIASNFFYFSPFFLIIFFYYFLYNQFSTELYKNA